MKTCKTCQQLLPLDSFYNHPKTADKKSPSCKSCTKKAVAARAAKLALDPTWAAKERERHRLKQQRYRAEGRACVLKGAKKTATIRKYRRKHPEKYKAHIAVGNAIRAGKLTRKPCEVCGAKKVHAHHDDYSQPLAVRWLCSIHHKQVHHTNA